jgi:hypothetical protein
MRHLFKRGSIGGAVTLIKTLEPGVRNGTQLGTLFMAFWVVVWYSINAKLSSHDELCNE